MWILILLSISQGLEALVRHKLGHLPAYSVQGCNISRCIAEGLKLRLLHFWRVLDTHAAYFLPTEFSTERGAASSFTC